MTVERLSDRLQALPRERAQALPALHILHDLAGYLAPDGLEEVGRWLHIPNADLYAVATSYTEFRSVPAEPGVIEVCRGLSCRLNGADALIADLRAVGRRVEERECFFACAIAPVADDSESPAVSGRASAKGAPPADAPVAPSPARTPTPEVQRPCP